MRFPLYSLLSSPLRRLAACSSLAVFLGSAGTLSAQNLAVTYYGPGNSLGGQIRNALTQAADGNFYGAAGGGITRLTPEGVVTRAYTFSALAADGTNVEGQRLLGGLTLGHDGNLYGLAGKGGALGHGTVFRFNPTTGAVQAVASLPADPADFGSSAPYLSSPPQDRAGNLYCQTRSVTTSGNVTTIVTSILKVTAAGSVSTLHADNLGFTSGLVIDGQDNLYGFTDNTFYQAGADGHFSVLYTYSGGDTTPRLPFDRANSIVATSDGAVYGVAQGLGGVSGGPGVGTTHGGSIFKAQGGQPVAIYTFSDGIFQDDGSYRNADGVFPNSLTLGTDGNLYGVTIEGGANGTGTVFRLTPSGGFTLLYTFPPNSYAFEPPTRSTDGNLYGHCYGDLGVFYRLGATKLPVFNASAISATATQGVQFSLQLVAANNPDTYTASGLPAGLSLDTKTGLITGATTAPLGVYTVALSAANPDGSGTATLTITVQAPLPDVPSINVPSGPVDAFVGVPFNYQVDATNKPDSYQFTGLPEGVTYDERTGLIHGLFANSGKILLELHAKNASGTGSASLEIDVAPANTLPIVTLAATANADAATGQAGAFTLTLSVAAGADVVVAYTIKGTAVNGVDYALLKGTAKLKAGKTSKAIKVKPQGDLGGASKKTVVLTLQPGTGYTVGTTDKVKVKITN